MSGPSAMAKPMSAKITASSSITWLTGWMRPASIPCGRVGKVTSTVSALRRAPRANSFNTARLAARASAIASLSALTAAPCSLRASGAIVPSPASSAEMEPFFPSAATRTVSSAASSCAVAISSRICVCRVWRSGMSLRSRGVFRLLPRKRGDVEMRGLLLALRDRCDPVEIGLRTLFYADLVDLGGGIRMHGGNGRLDIGIVGGLDLAHQHPFLRLLHRAFPTEDACDGKHLDAGGKTLFHKCCCDQLGVRLAAACCHHKREWGRHEKAVPMRFGRRSLFHGARIRRVAA